MAAEPVSTESTEVSELQKVREERDERTDRIRAYSACLKTERRMRREVEAERDHDQWFLCCCWAIIWAIQRYRELAPAETPTTLTLTRDDRERLGAIATILELQGVDRDGRDSRFLRQLRDGGASK